MFHQLNNTDYIQTRICEIFDEIGILKDKYKGAKYLEYAILFSVANPHSSTLQIYWAVANKFQIIVNVIPYDIKKGVISPINYAITQTWEKGNSENFKKYFGSSKPGSLKFITTIAEYLRNN